MEYPTGLEISDRRVYSVRVLVLRASDSARQQGQDQEHIDRLLASEADFPPILVHRPTMRVIDGMHRLRVAILRGRREIAARFFDGSATDAFVLGVQTNLAHGLPLALADRTAAAGRILRSHPQWSNRAIAKVAGLAPGTVAALRDRSTEQNGHLNVRVGQDGRARPLDSSRGRRTAYQILTENPDIPLREVARLSQISVGTVHDVGARLRRGLGPVPEGRRSAHDAAGSSQAAAGGSPVRDQAVVEVPKSQADVRLAMQTLRKDPSLRFTENGRALLRLLDLNTQAMTQRECLINGIPAHCAESVVGLADECARTWIEFAERLRTSAEAAV